MYDNLQSDQPIPHEGYVPVENAVLYYREIGQGQPIIVLHGGPTFDHNYLLPDMDHLSDSFRLIYYDQRGRANLWARYGSKMSPSNQRSKIWST